MCFWSERKQGEGTGPNICRQVLYNFSTQLCQSTPRVTSAFNGKCVFLRTHSGRRMRPPSWSGFDIKMILEHISPEVSEQSIPSSCLVLPHTSPQTHPNVLMAVHSAAKDRSLFISWNNEAAEHPCWGILKKRHPKRESKSVSWPTPPSLE